MVASQFAPSSCTEGEQERGGSLAMYSRSKRDNDHIAVADRRCRENVLSTQRQGNDSGDIFVYDTLCTLPMGGHHKVRRAAVFRSRACRPSVASRQAPRSDGHDLIVRAVRDQRRHRDLVRSLVKSHSASRQGHCKLLAYGHSEIEWDALRVNHANVACVQRNRWTQRQG
jgi:hypothetical protein